MSHIKEFLFPHGRTTFLKMQLYLQRMQDHVFCFCLFQNRFTSSWPERLTTITLFDEFAHIRTPRSCNKNNNNNWVKSSFHIRRKCAFTKCGISLYRRFDLSTTKTNVTGTPALPSFLEWNVKESKIASASKNGKILCRRLRAQVYVCVVRFAAFAFGRNRHYMTKSRLNLRSHALHSDGLIAEYRLPEKKNTRLRARPAVWHPRFRRWLTRFKTDQSTNWHEQTSMCENRL